MLKDKREIKDFIKYIFYISEIRINGVRATREDLVRLCEDISSGKANIRPPRQLMQSGRITKIWLQTVG